MDPFRPSNSPRSTSRDHQVLDAVVGYRYYAPDILVRNEDHERMLAEAALSRLLNETVPSTGLRRLTDVIRHRLRNLDVNIATRLQGAQPHSTTAPAAPGSEWTAA